MDVNFNCPFSHYGLFHPEDLKLNILVSKLSDGPSIVEKRKEIEELIRPSYVNATSLIDRALSKGQDLYELRDEDGALISFFMVGWHSLTVAEKVVPAVYLGLSATTQQAKNSGIVRNLYMRFIEDAIGREGESQEQVVCWATTATPSAFFAVHKLWIDVEPDAKGVFSNRGLEYVRAIREYLQMPQSNQDHPFVVKSIAVDTRYSKAERIRINEICEKHNFHLLRELGVDEAKGDRLILVAHLPKAHGDNTLVSMNS